MTSNQPKANDDISKQVRLACMEVTKVVVAKARETNTPIIVFDGDRIQQLSADEYVQLVKGNTTTRKNGEDHS